MADTHAANMKPVGARVALFVSDPWDFYTNYGPGPFKSTVVSVVVDKKTGPYWVVDMDEVLSDGGTGYSHACVTNYLVKPALECVLEGSKVPASVRLLTTTQAALRPEAMLRKAEGNPGFIGTVTLEKSTLHS
jgi:hypothetical protein